MRSAVAGRIDVWGWNMATKSLAKLAPDFSRRQPTGAAQVAWATYVIAAKIDLRFSDPENPPFRP